MALQMKVRCLAFDPPSNMFAVVLSDLEDKQALPIWIGPFEANAILVKLKNVCFHRPQSHDLIRSIVEAFDAEILKIEVMDLKDNTYYALIHVKADGKEITIDSRPSDAIAIAVGAGVPIYVTEKVLSKAKTIDLDRLEEWVGSLKPEDFKYKA